jgi:hypothetical protein
MPNHESMPRLSGFKWARISLSIAALMFALVLIGLISGNEMTIGLAGAAVLIALIFAFVSSLTSLRARPILKRMAEGDHYVHWRYAGAEWERHLAAEKKRNISTTLLMVFIIAAFLAMVGIGIALEINYRESQGLAPHNLAYWLRWMIPLTIPVTVLLVAGVMVDAVEKWHRDVLRREGGRVYIGREGIYYCGEFWPSARSPLQYCESASLEAGEPANLVFRFKMLNLRHSPASTTVQNSYRAIHVPVPVGRDEEARVALGKVLQDWFPQQRNG